MKIGIKRVYEPAGAADGRRVLVDRVWPRGLTKAEAAVDLWLKEVAPSTALRKWFGHDPARWSEFQTRYRAELAQPAPAKDGALAELRAAAKAGKVTLVFAAKDEAHSNAMVLQHWLAGHKC